MSVPATPGAPRAPRAPGASQAPRARWRTLVLALAGVVAAHAAVAQGTGCGGLANNYGPYDYRQYKDAPEIDPVTRQMSPLQMVEGAHFIDTCEALVKCKRGTIGSDIDYTLRAFPNHHRALVAMMLYGDRTKRDQPPDALFTVDCYFKRALAWKSDDVIVRLIYAGYLNGKGKPAPAKEQLEAASKLTGDNAFSVYNVGMVALDLNQVDLAVESARKAYGAGMTHPVLRQRLMAINRWPTDIVLPGEAAFAPESSPASSPAAAAAASAASAPESAAPATAR
ncbi:tetratricopeptide repeat protein [Roseateles sp. UC29_93]|uniref:tetratricopeptide repeat protein n=1 Tax=Roseateles sp. UC29_93 TaxID=3350177 RepID=UPI003673295E